MSILKQKRYLAPKNFIYALISLFFLMVAIIYAFCCYIDYLKHKTYTINKRTSFKNNTYSSKKRYYQNNETSNVTFADEIPTKIKSTKKTEEKFLKKESFIYSDNQLDQLFIENFSLSKKENASIQKKSLLKKKEKNSKKEINKKIDKKTKNKIEKKDISSSVKQNKQLKNETIDSKNNALHDSSPIKKKETALVIKKEIEKISLKNNLQNDTKNQDEILLELKNNINNTDHYKNNYINNSEDKALLENENYSYNDSENNIDDNNNENKKEEETAKETIECNNYVDRIVKAAQRFPGKKIACTITCTYSNKKQFPIVEITSKKQISNAYRAHIIAIIQRNEIPIFLHEKTIKIVM